MSHSLEPSGRCPYCNDLYRGDAKAYIPFDEWVFGISSSLCQTCQILTQAIRRLEPEFLTGRSRPNTNVRFEMDEHGWVSIGTERNRLYRREVQIQFYYSFADNG